MSFEINPRQPFEVRTPKSVSDIQQQSLIQLYQPLIGPVAVSLYYTLFYLPKDQGKISQRFMHAQLIQKLNIGIQDCNQARQRLEAVGLLRTYRQRKSHKQWQHQTLLYDLQLPYDIRQFLNHPLLSTALFNQIGDQHYYELLKEWEIQPLAEDDYAEITTPFQSVFQYVGENNQDEIDASLKGRQFQSSQRQEEQVNDVSDFDYSQFLSYVMAEGIDHSQLTMQLKGEVLAVHQIYQLDEIRMSQIVMLAVNDLSGKVELEKIKEIASKKQYYRYRNQSAGTVVNQSKQTQKGKLSPSWMQEQRASLSAKYPHLSKDDIELVIVCKQVPMAAFLRQTKETKGGFVTDNEQFYLSEIQKVTRLNEETLNFLCYYLLIILKREGLYKGDLQRIASQWQQNNIQSAPEAIAYVRQQEKAKQIKNKQQESYRKNVRSKAGREDIIPSWMQEISNENSSTTPVNQENDSATSQAENPRSDGGEEVDEAAIRQRLAKLFKKEGEE